MGSCFVGFVLLLGRSLAQTVEVVVQVELHLKFDPIEVHRSFHVYQTYAESLGETEGRLQISQPLSSRR